MTFEILADGSITDIDMATAIKRLNDDAQLYTSVVAAFVNRTRLSAHEIVDALERGDLKTAVRSAHSLKGICGSLGANSLMELAQSVEDILKVNGHPDTQMLDELFHAERDLVNTFGAWLKKDVNPIDPLSTLIQSKYNTENTIGTILIVDDAPESTLLLVSALQADYQIELCGSGEAALDRLSKRDKPDLILLDIVLPGIDGYETLKKLKHNEDTKNIPVIFFTGLRSVDDESKGLNLGAVDYVTKPFSMAVAKARIRTHIELKKKTDILEALSFKDGLTGVENRYSFNLAFRQYWEYAQRRGEIFSLCMIDVDYFKQYNDHYGHQKGDDCLKKVAAQIQTVCEDTRNRVFRYGGEEFVLLLPASDLAFALSVAESIRGKISALEIDHESSQVSHVVTVSIGVSSVLPSPSNSGELLLFVADHELYNAKTQGRNRVSGRFCN